MPIRLMQTPHRGWRLPTAIDACFRAQTAPTGVTREGPLTCLHATFAVPTRNYRLTSKPVTLIGF
jgi:hypothetical protein